MRLNDMGIIVIVTVIGACMVAGFFVKRWKPTTVEGKIEKEVIEEVLDTVETTEEKDLKAAI